MFLRGVGSHIKAEPIERFNSPTLARHVFEKSTLKCLSDRLTWVQFVMKRVGDIITGIAVRHRRCLFRQLQNRKQVPVSTYTDVV